MSWALDPQPVMSSVGSVCVGQMWSAESVTDASLVTLDFHAAGVSSFQWLISLSEERDLKFFKSSSSAHWACSHSEYVTQKDQ